MTFTHIVLVIRTRSSGKEVGKEGLEVPQECQALVYEEGVGLFPPRAQWWLEKHVPSMPCSVRSVIKVMAGVKYQFQPSSGSGQGYQE